MAFKMKGFNPGQGTGMAKNLARIAMKKQKDYVPQTKSRKNIESDITPQSIKKDKGKFAKIEHRRTIKRNFINPKKSPNKKKKFPDLNKDGKITQADVLMGRGVINSPNKLKKDKRKRIIKEKEIDPETGGTIRYKKKYRKSGELKKYKIRDPKGKVGEKYSKFKKDKAGNIKDGEHHPSGLFKMKKSPMKKMDPPATQAKIKKMIIAGIEKNMDDRDIRNKINQMSDGSLDYTYNRKTKKVTIKKGGSTGFEGFDETDPDKG